MSFAISSLALFFLQEYNVIVSSESSGGEHDSTGLGAKQKLITPLLRCASPETATLYSELFETTQQNKKGSPRLPFCVFGVDENYSLANDGFRCCGLLLLSMTYVLVRNFVVVVPLRRVPMMVPVVRRGTVRGLRRGRARGRQDRRNR